MYRKITIFIILFTLLLQGSPALAGFGISPPYVKSDKLSPGSHFEQKITLLRSSAEEILEATVVVNAPEIASWVSIEGGDVFDLPIGQLQTPMIVNIDVPENADFDNFKGHLNIRISPKDKDKNSGVAIALGARVDIDVTVTNETIPDFLLKKTEILDFEELRTPWNWPIFSWFFYRLQLVMKIENIGNVSTSPSRVVVDVYDIAKKNLLISLEDKNIPEIEPFMTTEVKASYPIKLKEGQYWGKIKIYKDNDIVYTDEKTFTISPIGTLGNKAPSFGIKPYLLMALYVFILFIILIFLIKIRSWKALYFIFIFPLILTLKFIGRFFTYLNLRFWKWIGRKASKYQNIDKK